MAPVDTPRDRVKLVETTESENMSKNVHYVNNTCADISPWFALFAEAYRTGVICESLSDLFSITILKGYNPDGSDRMVIAPAQ